MKKNATSYQKWSKCRLHRLLATRIFSDGKLVLLLASSWCVPRAHRQLWGLAGSKPQGWPPGDPCSPLLSRASLVAPASAAGRCNRTWFSSALRRHRLSSQTSSGAGAVAPYGRLLLLGTARGSTHGTCGAGSPGTGTCLSPLPKNRAEMPPNFKV